MTTEQLAASAITYTIETEPEYDGPEGHFSSGDDALDAQLVQEINDAREWNEWAWCTVKVTARFEGLEGAAYLGACSYKDEADFKAGGYYEQMQQEAREELGREVANTRTILSNWDYCAARGTL